MRVKINLETTHDAIELAKIATYVSGKVLITDGNGLTVNAKSVMGALYALEFSDLWLESEKDIYSMISKFVKLED